MPKRISEALRQLPQESNIAYYAFMTYIDLGHERTLEKARLKLGRKPGYIRVLEEWSSRHQWQERLRGFHSDLEQYINYKQREIVATEREKYLDNVIKLNSRVEQMIDDWTSLRISKRELIDDPRDLQLPEDQRRKIERITLRVNTRDLELLVRAFGALNKDMRTVLGLPTHVDVTSGDKPLQWPALVEVHRLPAPDNEPSSQPNGKSNGSKKHA